MQFTDSHYNFIWIEPKMILYSAHTISSNNPGNLIFLEDDTIWVNGPHVISTDHSNLTFVDHSAEYHFVKNLNVNTNSISPKIVEFKDIFDKFNFKTVLELGGCFGSSSLWLLNNLSDLSKLDIVEMRPFKCNLIKNRLANCKNFNVVNIYPTNAAIGLNCLTLKYDLVFFDLSHHFDIDRLAINNLIPFISDKTVLIFDDYNLADVKQLVRYSRKLLSCKIFVQENNKILEIV